MLTRGFSSLLRSRLVSSYFDLCFFIPPLVVIGKGSLGGGGTPSGLDFLSDFDLRFGLSLSLISSSVFDLDLRVVFGAAAGASPSTGSDLRFFFFSTLPPSAPSAFRFTSASNASSYFDVLGLIPTAHSASACLSSASIALMFFEFRSDFLFRSFES